MENIGIFCSASNNIDPVFFRHASELGKWLGENKKTLIYGGANLGLMDCVSRTAKDNGSKIIGVVPTRIFEMGWASAFVDEMIPCKNLTDRKDIMLQRADVLVALPGGISKKKIIFYNVEGFWQDMIKFLKQLESQHFAHHPLNNYYAVANNLEELTELLK